MNDIYIYSVPLPARIRGVTVERTNGTIIFVNEYLSKEAQEEAIKHELKHAEHDHVYDLRCVGEIEKEAAI